MLYPTPDGSTLGNSILTWTQEELPGGKTRLPLFILALLRQCQVGVTVGATSWVSLQITAKIEDELRKPAGPSNHELEWTNDIIINQPIKKESRELPEQQW